MALGRSSSEKTLSRIRQGGRHDERAADTLDRPGRDQRIGRADQRAAERPEPEHHESEEECAAPAELVAETPGGEEQTREHECVGVGNPLQLALGRAELADEARERDIDDRAVDPDNEQRQAQDREDRPAPPVDLLVNLGRRTLRPNIGVGHRHLLGAGQSGPSRRASLTPPPLAAASAPVARVTTAAAPRLRRNPQPTS